jgi:hypothetical protein
MSQRTSSPSCRARQAVVDRFAEPAVRDRHHRDTRGAGAIEAAQLREQIRRRFDQIAARREVQYARGFVSAGNKRWAECE